MMDIDFTKPLSDEEKNTLIKLSLKAFSEQDSDEVKINVNYENISFNIFLSLKNTQIKKESKKQ